MCERDGGPRGKGDNNDINRLVGSGLARRAGRRKRASRQRPSTPRQG
jgi:hypothetical protein